MNYQTIKETYNATFENDYEIVQHGHLRQRDPFDPNSFEETYNLTALPRNETVFITQLNHRQVLIENCMDKNVSPLLWQIPLTGDRTVITRAGGTIQIGAREDAVTALHRYVAQNLNTGNISKLQIVLGDHNHTCGAVAHFLGGRSISEIYGVQPRDTLETAVMQQLITGHSAPIREIYQSIPATLISGLFDTQRDQEEQPPQFVIFEPENIPPLRIEDLIAEATTQPYFLMSQK